MSGVVACVLTVSQDPWFWARIDDRVGLRGVNWVVGGEEVRVAFRGRHEHALREIWLRQLRTSGTGVLHHFSIRHDQSSPCPPRRTQGAQRSRHGRFRARPRTGNNNFMVGKRSGRVAYAVMSFGGWLGMGESYHPLPWDTLRYDTDLGGYVVSLDRDRLRGAPSHRADQDTSSDASYWRRVKDYWA